ncbi:MAG: helicase-related protein, partial [Candidatus Latescibacterota bacterium]|nr:helicase-related protein [Candidatus Latescibacterota bacterium]
LRTELLTAIHTGSAHIAVGTHALIQPGIDLPDLGLVIIDEQHRFGVLQRLQLQAKGPEADLLVMTATPIPRSLALTMYGDLDVSVLDEVPTGRRPIRTELRTPERRERILAFVADRLSQGEQAYIIYPAIEESENDDTRSVVAAFDELSSGPFASFEVGLLHGRMTAEEKVDTMGRYGRGEIRALVATTVVEVGLDVPNATVMLVEHAERFGLAQLHQLRGRVGRGGSQAYCILITYGEREEEAGGRAVEERLRVLCETDDGFAIARRDLELRGQGEVLGHRQAGQPYFAVADLLGDEELLVAARAEATRLVGGDDTAAEGDGERERA